MTARRPDFFLAGAPKCGTTALYEYLRTHPRVFLPQLKEPRFFAEDYADFREVRDLDEYERMYAHIPDTAQAVGDGSPWYLSSLVAIERIRDYSPGARIVLMLRNPLDVLPSLHNQFLFSFKETERDLERAWQLQGPRARGECLPPAHPAPRMLQYAELLSFGRQYEALLRHFPASRLKVILFDDFRRDTPGAYAQVLDFLGLEHDGRAEFPVVNEAAAHRNAAVGWAFNSPASPLNRLIYRVRDLTGLKSTGLLAPLLRGNRQAAAKAHLTPVLREQVAKALAPDVARLGELIGRDLSSWLGEGQSGQRPESSSS